MDEPPVKMWVMGANAWYYADDWPVPGTDWKKLYLHSWGRLREKPFVPGSRDDYSEPDAFVQMPPTQTRKIEKLRYMTEPLPKDVLIAGPDSIKPVCFHRPGGYKLDYLIEGCRAGCLGQDGPGRRK